MADNSDENPKIDVSNVTEEKPVDSDGDLVARILKDMEGPEKPKEIEEPKWVEEEAKVEEKKEVVEEKKDIVEETESSEISEEKPIEAADTPSNSDEDKNEEEKEEEKEEGGEEDEEEEEDEEDEDEEDYTKENPIVVIAPVIKNNELPWPITCAATMLALTYVLKLFFLFCGLSNCGCKSGCICVG